ASLKELEEINGVGFAKACQIKAIGEIVKRIHRLGFSPNLRVSNPFEAYSFLKGVFSWEREEVFVLLLNAKGMVLGVRKVSQGTLTESPIYPREIVSVVVRANASKVILAHNHLSGDPAPSQEDLYITDKLKKLLGELDIKLDDHIIVGRGRFYSFATRAVLEEG
ncbi:MAG: DNA repair protein RadC, partial [Chloroflexi bacterium]|nr:DNA repair protein RadC [Chloroflexota bacterium]